MSIIQFDEWEEFVKWPASINRLAERYWLLTNYRKDGTLGEPLVMVLRPSVGGRMDTAYLRLDLSKASVDEIMKSTLVRVFTDANRLLHIKAFMPREDSYDVAQLGRDE
jgi:hypothetical protein